MLAVIGGTVEPGCSYNAFIFPSFALCLYFGFCLSFALSFILCSFICTLFLYVALSFVLRKAPTQWVTQPIVKLK